MSFTPRSCLHCGGTRLYVIPGVQLEIWQTTTVLGMQASSKKGGGRRWTMTLVTCAQCGRTETFTTNAPELASIYAGSQEITTTRTN